MTTTVDRTTPGAADQAREFRLPDVGEGLTEADIVTWHVAVGDTVEDGQTIVDIETAKSIVELPSPYAGEVTAILVAEGETAAVGTPIIRIGGGGDDAVGASEASHETEGEDDEAPQPLVGYGSRPEVRRGSRTRRATGSAGTADDAADDDRGDQGGRPRAKPPVRRLAAQLGIDLRDVTATGPDRVTTREDVEAHAAGSAGSREAPGEEAAERIPVTGVRKHTAAAMSASVAAAPHATLFTTVDVTRTVELRERLLGRPEFRDTPVSPLVLVARAYLHALQRTPVAHARWVAAEDGSAEIVVPTHVGLGIAAATPRGLLVPVIERADTLSLHDLASALVALTATARAGRTPPEAMTGGTTTITNVGVFGIDGGTPILNPGESSILAVGAIRRRPWVTPDAGTGEERLEVRSVMQLSLSFDHRVMDGAEGARVLADTAGVLEDPGLALL